MRERSINFCANWVASATLLGSALRAALNFLNSFEAMPALIGMVSSTCERLPGIYGAAIKSVMLIESTKLVSINFNIIIFLICEGSS